MKHPALKSNADDPDFSLEQGKQKKPKPPVRPKPRKSTQVDYRAVAVGSNSGSSLLDPFAMDSMAKDAAQSTEVTNSFTDPHTFKPVEAPIPEDVVTGTVSAPPKPAPAVPKRRGRPPGAKNKTAAAKKGPGKSKSGSKKKKGRVSSRNPLIGGSFVINTDEEDAIAEARAQAKVGRARALPRSKAIARQMKKSTVQPAAGEIEMLLHFSLLVMELKMLPAQG